MNEIDMLLSDEFVEFSGKIKELHERKKTKQSEFKALYDKFKAEVQAMDDEAKGLQKDFETWKDGQGKVTTAKKTEVVAQPVDAPVSNNKAIK